MCDDVDDDDVYEFVCDVDDNDDVMVRAMMCAMRMMRTMLRTRIMLNVCIAMMMWMMMNMCVPTFNYEFFFIVCVPEAQVMFICEHRRVWRVQYEPPLFDATLVHKDMTFVQISFY